MAAYEAAMKDGPAPDGAGESRTRAGTINAVIVSYYQTADFKSLRPSTQQTYRNLLERIRADHGDKSAATIERHHIEAIMGTMADRPAAANNFLRMFKIVMRRAISTKIRKDDPTLYVKKVSAKSRGFETWTEDHIAAFYECHKPGTRARLAIDLLLFTGQRRSDVIRMGRQHIRGGVLSITQQKTGTPVEIPVHPDLLASLEALPAKNMTFLLTESGKPFSPAGFGNWFRECAEAAGLPKGLAAHGLRKAACRRLAEAGCTAHEIMSISGHRSIKEVQRYCEDADRKRLAQQAAGRLGTPGKTESGTGIVKPGGRV